ncbi:hypothetical protein [Limnospira platensis]|uniref:hypothetical protein n=1 Tax=Limnospira platensis TaxID=118562 RepID=UPI003D6E834B
MTTTESSEKLKQTKLKGLIAKEKTMQLTHTLTAERINTTTARLLIDEARVKQETRQTQVQEQRLGLSIAQTNLQIRGLQLTETNHKLGMAQDSAKAVNADRMLTQRVMAEQLNAKRLTVTEMEASNRLKLEEIKAAYNKVAPIQTRI